MKGIDPKAMAARLLKDGWVEVDDIQSGDTVVTPTWAAEIYGGGDILNPLSSYPEGTRVFRKPEKVEDGPRASFVNAYNAALSQCIRSGVDPNELWLGPDMLSQLREHLTFMRVSKTVALKLWDGIGTYDGLTLRFMESDGLRVGRSFSPDAS